MKQSTWRILAFGALFSAVSLPASAQVVIGGGNTPSVEVNWSVLDNLGRQPTLADMLKGEVPANEARAASQPKAKGVQYRPFKAGAKPYAKPAKAAAAPKAKKSQVVPASAKSERMADLVQSSRSPAAKPVEAKSVAKPVAEVKPVEAAKPAIIGPQIALPEVPKPVAATAPVQLAKAEPPAPAPETKPEPKVEAAKVEAPKVELPKVEAPKVEAPKVEAPKVEAKAEPVALPPTALTPPPLPVAPKAVEAPQQVAALPPAPTPAPAAAPVAASRGSDTLTVPFSSESARLPDASHGDLDRLVKRMQKDDGLGLQLLAYAEGDDASASKARRLSLSRALEVRKYLMDQGIRSTRIEVRALGNKLEGAGSADRVDAVLVSR
jgi:outer membrane protein OmpA-like peptidoglycan-associated protein